MTVRIGVVTDTHVPEFLPTLPPGVKELLRGVDMIFHCGDITGMEVIRELEAIAPVHAVAGNHDDELPLPGTKIVEVEGVRFGLLHGIRWSPLWDNYLVAGTNALWWRWLHLAPGYSSYLVRQFDQPVDIVVHGHIHRPHRSRVGDTTLFSPGAVYMPTRKLLRWAQSSGWRPDTRAWVQQILLRIPTPIPPPAIGLIQIDSSGVRTERVELPRFR